VQSVRPWRRVRRAGGVEALRSKGPMAVERLSSAQWARLEAELRRGPLAGQTLCPGAPIWEGSS
jgi:hypothetical protein